MANATPPTQEKPNRWQTIGSSILHFTWTQGVLYWIILSAGTMSELAFLIASMWMSENAAAHAFVRQFMSEDMTKHLSWFATGAYVGLPVAILPLAILTVVTHTRVWIAEKRFRAPAIWCLLYALPTLVFLTLDVITVACSVLAVNFELPGILVVARALSAYMFALIALLYTQIGKPQEADRLRERDAWIAGHVEDKRLLTERLETQKRASTLQIEALQAELEGQKRATEEEKAARKRVLEELQRTDDAALEGYGEPCLNWLKSGIKTASVDEIIRFTGHSKRKVTNAIASANLQVSPRNKELVLVSSLIPWLKNTPIPRGQTEMEPPTLHIVNEGAKENAHERNTTGAHQPIAMG